VFYDQGEKKIEHTKKEKEDGALYNLIDIKPFDKGS